MSSNRVVLLAVSVLSLTAQAATAQLRATPPKPKEIVESGPEVVVDGFDPEKVFALVVGVSDYKNAPGLALEHCERDARQVAKFLLTLGVPEKNVTLMHDRAGGDLVPTAENINAQAKRRFHAKLPKGASLWFFYSGHGRYDAKSKTSYLIGTDVPADAVTPAGDATRKWLPHAVSLKGIKDAISAVPDAHVRLLFLDACRSAARDLEKKDDEAAKEALQGKDLYVFRSCAVTEKSWQDESLRHGVFTYQLLSGLRGLGALSDGLPDQWVVSNKLGVHLSQSIPKHLRTLSELYPKDGITTQTPTLLLPLGEESRSVPLCPATAFRNGLEMTLIRLPEGEGVFGSPNGERGRNEDLEISERKLALAWPVADDQKRRLVYIGRSEVTQRQYKAVTGENPSHFRPDGVGKAAITDKTMGGGNLPREPDLLPVESISWFDAIAFCDRLTMSENQRLKQAGFTVLYRLPTEEEWEYACRAGTRGPFGVGHDLVMGIEVEDTKTGKPWRGFVLTGVVNPTEQYSAAEQRFWERLTDDERKRTLPRVRPEAIDEGRYAFSDTDYRHAENDWGLLDTHGNVAEWTASRWTWPKDLAKVPLPRKPQAAQDAKSDMVVRGGSWRNTAGECRSASRIYHKAGSGNERIGFRVVCEVIYK